MSEQADSVIHEQSIAEWANAHKDRIFRVWTYRRMFTPYEQDKKYSDETEYQNVCASLGRIVEIISLTNGDYLIGFEQICTFPQYIFYRRLSEITLEYYKGDFEEEEEFENMYEDDQENECT